MAIAQADVGIAILASSGRDGWWDQILRPSIISETAHSPPYSGIIEFTCDNLDAMGQSVGSQIINRINHINQ